MGELYNKSERSLIFREKRTDGEWILWKVCSPSKNTVLELANEFDVTGNLAIGSIRKAWKKGFYQNKDAFSYYFFEGVTLKEFLQNHPFSIPEFFDIALRLVSVVNQLHESGVLHLRLNSNNVLYNPGTGAIQLIDFSLACQRHKARPASLHDWGSELAYISPEQTGHLNQVIDERADLYSLGIIFYEMLAGQLPFPANDSASLIHDHLVKIPAALSILRQQVPPALSAIVEKLLTKNPEGRYQTADGLEQDLRQCDHLIRKNTGLELFELGTKDEKPLHLTNELIGRTNEQTGLNELLDDVTEGGNRLALISGEQGTGKTALIGWLNKTAIEKGGIVIACRFTELEENRPYSAFVSALEDLAEQILSQEEDRLAEWKRVLNKAVDHKPFLIDLVPSFSWLLNLETTLMPEPAYLPHRTDFGLLFLKLIKEMAASRSFVVLSVDDVQWADVDSVKCIRSVVAEKSLANFLFVGGYRLKHGRALAHSGGDLWQGLTEMPNRFEVVLKNLTQEQVRDYLLQSFTSDNPETISDLAFSRTLGNPFFLQQFLHLLYKNKILLFDRKQQKWNLDEAKTVHLQVTDNVADMVAGRVQRLQAGAKAVLQYASCIGDEFSLHLLANITSASEPSVVETLRFLIAEALIKQQNGERYCFAHKRIRTAAYNSMDKEQRSRIHYQIAVRQQSVTSSEDPAIIFNLVGHYNKGRRHVPSQDFFAIAVLNLKAGLLAKHTAAFDLSYSYLKNAVSLLLPEDWTTQYETVLQIYNEATEVAMITGAYADAERWLRASLQQARSFSDRLKAYEIKLNHYSEAHQFTEAVAYLLNVLEEIGCTIKRHPGKLTVLKEFAAVKWFLRNKPVNAIPELKSMTDEKANGFLKLTVNALSSIFGSAPDILPIVIFRQVRFSLQYGNSAYSPYAYASYGFAISTFMNDLTGGYRFGKMALELAGKLNADVVKAKVMVIFYGFLSYWKDSLRQSIAPLHEAFLAGRQTGDLLYAAFALIFRDTVRLHSGDPLAEVFDSLTEDCKIINEMKQELVYLVAINQLQLVHNLVHVIEDPLVFKHASFNETTFLAKLEKSKDQATLFDFYYSKLMLACIFNEMEKAFVYSEKASRYEEETTARQIIYPSYLVYSIMATVKNAAADGKKPTRKKLGAKMKTLQTFARHAPQNYRCKLLFVYAVLAESRNETGKAENFFQKAIAEAQKSNFIHDEAMAREHLANVYMKTGNQEYAEMMLHKAFICYQRWGAVSKCAQLKKAFPDLLKESPVLNADINISTVQNIYDLRTIIDANQVLSSENSLEGLLKRMLEIVIQNASADKAVIVLKEGRQQVAKAIGSNKGIEVLSWGRADDPAVFPVSLVNLVERTSQPYTSDNLSAEKKFQFDAYLEKHHPVSVCCIPVHTKSNFLGALYLENNLAEAAFNSKKVAFFSTIASQLAISLENVFLYAEMEQKVKERTTELTLSLQELKAAQEQLIHREKMASLGELTAGIAHEIQNPLNFINNFADVNAELLEELKKEADGGNRAVVIHLAEDIAENGMRILQNGKRVDNIIKGMLLHSQGNTGQRELTDINSFIEEYLQLSYHGFRAKDKLFNVVLTRHFDPSAGKLRVVPQDIGRVLLNLFNNAFYSLQHKKKIAEGVYEPLLKVQTERINDHVRITVRDNGLGIPAEILPKIYQPFFTTKPTGEGTGLGLSLSYDIITKVHHGEISVDSKEGEGAAFMLHLPANES